MIMQNYLPPDPEGMNDERASWAGCAVAAFQRATRCDEEDALGDLLADLMHWADRSNYDFEAALLRGRDHYAAETTAGEETEHLRRIVPKLLTALQLAQRTLNTAPRFRVDETDSYAVASLVDQAIAEADGGRS